jgi:Asp-tRNA(Asn)/Glu-tRNA(Gln) amidotransferase B subunit
MYCIYTLMCTAITGYLSKAKRTIIESSLTPDGLAEMIALIKSGKITGKICKELLPELLDKPLKGDSDVLVTTHSLIITILYCAAMRFLSNAGTRKF